MKKLLAVILVGLMIFSITACGSDDAQNNVVTDAKQKTSDVSVSAGIDLKAEGTQALSNEKVETAVLKNTVEEFLEGVTIFKYSDDTRTYDDFVEYIGCEATEYQYQSSNNEGTYIWRASDNSTAWFAVTFGEENGSWKLYAAGSANLGLDVNN